MPVILLINLRIGILVFIILFIIICYALMMKTFYDEYIKKTCNLLIIKDENTLPEFDQIFNNFMKLETKICSFDMEFNNSKKRGRYISIIQLGLYIHNNLFIIMLDTETVPKTLPYVTKLFIDETIVKIGHGTDSLDVPAVNKLLGDEYTIRFINRLYDTRFLCEYVHILTGETKSNLYAGYSQFNVVDKKQIDNLENIEHHLGNFWNTTIHITSLSDNLINYAMYDVIYLMKLLTNIKKRIIELELDYTLGVHVTRWMLMIRLKLIDMPKSDEFNTFYFDNIPLKTHFQTNIDEYLEQTPVKFTMILINPLFKKHLIPMFQTIYYSKMSNVHKINKTKSNVLNDIDKNKLKSIINKFNNDLISFPSISCMLNDYIMYID